MANAVTLIIAIIGALAGIVGGALSGRREARLDQQKWNREISEAFKSDLRSTVRDLITKIAEAIHAMCWLCWLAKYGPEQLEKAKTEQYDAEMHTLLPQITGLYAVIAGMDQEVYNKLGPIIREVMSLDAQVGAAGLIFDANKPDTARGLADLHQQTLDLNEKLLSIASDALHPYAVTINAS